MITCSSDIGPDKMYGFEMDERNVNLHIILPYGMTKKQLVERLEKELTEIDILQMCIGKNIFIDGHLTTHVAFFLGHFLGYVSNSVHVYDPMEKEFVICVKHVSNIKNM